MRRLRSIPTFWRSVAASAVEVVVAVALATAAIAALQSTAPPAGLGIVYVLAVLAVAIRRGQLPALCTAILGVLTLNYLYITPRHQLGIAHSQDVVELSVLLIAAVVVGRLAALARKQAAEADDRARVAAAREREAGLLADTAAGILAHESLAAQLESVGNRVSAASDASHARVVLEKSSAPGSDEDAVPLPSQRRNAWLYVSRESPYDRALIERLATPIAGLIDVAVERERAAGRVAEAEAARRAEVARTAILHAISHDLRSPITAITTAASALRSADVTVQERHELIGAIEAESGRLARVVGDLLDLSRIEAGAVAPRADWCDLRDLAVTAAHRFQAAHPIELDIPADLPLVRADAAQLERVFSNLIENAVKFSAPGAPVQITGGAGPAWVTARVIDHGPGIPLEQRRHIFEPFFRGRGGGAGGSGLGLAIARGFVEANGGNIVVQSNIGLGTSFAVRFPRVTQPERQEEPTTLSGVGDS
jgi:two-component system, OmpR family, sensor histidine kinase KdpD